MNPLRDFDYHVACDDFLLYELGRLIEEDKASFDEAEFEELPVRYLIGESEKYRDYA